MRNIILIVCFLHALLGYTQENGDLYLEKAQLFLDNENDSVLIFSKKAKTEKGPFGPLPLQRRAQV